MLTMRAGVPMEIMCLMFGDFVDDYAVKVCISITPSSLEDDQSQFQLMKTGIATWDFCTPNARLYGHRCPNQLLTAWGDSGVIEQSISYLGLWRCVHSLFLLFAISEYTQCKWHPAV
ncbi:unnamed protein product [Urochloa humidicola]